MRSTRPIRALAFVLILGVPFGGVSEGQSPRGADSGGIEDAGPDFQAQAAEYEFQTVDDGQRFVRQDRSLLHWSNPARGGEDGDVFLWTDEGAPAVIGTCFTYVYNNSVRRKHAFRTLSDRAVVGRHRGRVVWNAPQQSLAFHRIEGAPRPAPRASQQTAQLRLLARRFGVELTQKDGRQEHCRLVPQPLFRFTSDADPQRNGAIFSFAVGTDPEALLILEQRTDESGEPQWHYAFARFTFYPLEGFLDGGSVWKKERSESLMSNILQRPDYQREPYITFRPDWLD